MSDEELGGIRALIVDDQRTMRTIVYRLLKQIGIEHILEAEDGNKALEILQQATHTPDVVICDLHMDGMDGLEFCQKVRLSKHTKIRDVKIIVLTGDKDYMMRSISRQVGAIEVLSKPVTAEELRDTIAKAVGFAL